ncbi:MAG: carboxypeptidase-like regulatory domain-containing protein [Algibacter sp.]|uniref:carboxypeptidase-like regulatory domain-containing protein n=1 Tax=Algibacter sp. TaxID=1872428 RepID=UPI003297B437
MSRSLLFVLLILLARPTYSQTIELLGRVASNGDIENIHVINNTAQVFTTTDKEGHFKISARLNDTLSFSSIQYKLKEVIITQSILDNEAVFVTLNEHINELDEVIVGKVLTGDLLSDIRNMDANAPINFYDVGIPGYTGKPATQSERRLYTAGVFKPEMLLGLVLGGGSLDPIINGISGRTKMLKKRVAIEDKETLMQSIKGRLSKDFFASNSLEESLRIDFFYFCADDPVFVKRCKNQTDFNILAFLRVKYKQYLTNLEASKN